MLFKIVLFIIVLFNTIYLLSYALWERKQKNLKGFVGVCVLVSAVLSLFLSYIVD